MSPRKKCLLEEIDCLEEGAGGLVLFIIQIDDKKKHVRLPKEKVRSSAADDHLKTFGASKKATASRNTL